MGSSTSTSQHRFKRRFMVARLTPLCFARSFSDVAVVQCSMNWVNVAASLHAGGAAFFAPPPRGAEDDDAFVCGNVPTAVVVFRSRWVDRLRIVSMGCGDVLGPAV